MVEKQSIVILSIIALIFCGIVVGILITDGSTDEEQGVIRLWRIDENPENFIEIGESDLEKYPILEEMLDSIKDADDNSVIRKVGKPDLESLEDYLDKKYENKYGFKYFLGILKHGESFYEIDFQKQIPQ